MTIDEAKSHEQYLTYYAKPPPQSLSTRQAAILIPFIRRSHKINAGIGRVLPKDTTQGKSSSSGSPPLREASGRFHSWIRSAAPWMKVGAKRTLILLAKQDKASPSTSRHDH